MSNVRPEYVTPEVVTYRDSEILKQMPVKGIGSAPQNFLGTSTEDPGKRPERYRSIFDRSLLEDPDK
ncbi:hypothetical protein ACFL6S_25035 [Candidatus Poribacteria bacterium]